MSLVSFVFPIKEAATTDQLEQTMKHWPLYRPILENNKLYVFVFYLRVIPNPTRNSLYILRYINYINDTL